MALKLGVLIDKLRAKDVSIRKAEAVVSELKRERVKLETKLLRAFDKDDIDGAKGKKGVASVKRSNHPTIKDRRRFMKYLIQHKAWDLLQNRIAPKAYFDRLEEGESVPGVEVFEKFKVSVRERK